ncbi:unnamed protein product [Bubo scandiacus]
MGAPGQLVQLKPTDLLEQEPDAFAEASPEQAEDTTDSHFLAWLNTADSKDTIPDVPDSPGVTAFLQQLPDLSAYVGESSSPKEQWVVAGLGNSEDTVPDVLDIPNSLTDTACLDELPDLSMYAVEGDGPQDQAAVAHLGDSVDTISPHYVPNLPADVLEELPDPCRAEGGCNNEQAAAVMLVEGEIILPDVLDSLASTAPSSEAPDFLGYGAHSDWPEDRLAAAMLGDTDPFWGVPASPSQDPTGQQGGMAAELPTWLPPSRSETVKESSAESPLENAEESSEESPRKDPLQHLRDSALLDSVLLRIPLLSPVSSPPRPSRRHPPRTAQLVEEVPRRQHQVGLTRLPLPLDAQAGSSKRRASDGNNVPTKRARSLRDARDRVPPAPPDRF